LIYKKAITHLIPCGNCKKIEDKKPKILLYHRKKEVVPKDYKVIRLYKKYEILKKPIIH
jgi:hypothetical protein